jgi:hypothetical protein
MVPLHDLVPLRIAAHQKRTLNRRARRTAADNAAALQKGVEFGLRPRIQVGIGEPPLSPAAEPDAGRRPERRD